MESRHLQSTRAPPLDLSHYFSDVTKNRQASDVKRFYKYFALPGMHNLAGGLPHMSYFPFDTLEASAAHPHRFEPTPITPVDPEPPKSNRNPAALHVKVPKESKATNVLSKIDLQTALQYGTADGYPPLSSFIRQFTRDHLHPNVPYANGPEVILTCGSTDGFSKAIETFTNPWIEHKDDIRDRSGILCEEFAYMNAIQTVRPRGLNIVPVVIDSQGMIPSGEGGLADILENWDFSKGKRPHLMYTVTLGQNPTGTTMPIERRKEIYALCQMYDIIIIEDEPYWNLQYPSAIQALDKPRGGDEHKLFNRNYNAHGRSSGYDFLDSLVPSYLSIDTDGRVVRVDTFSKTIAPGCRLGWLTAQPAVVERITRITETSTQQPSGFVQAMVAQLLKGQSSSAMTNRASKSDEAWTMDGWVRWLEGLRGGYERRMQNMCKTLDDGKYVVVDSAPGSYPDSWSMVSKVPMYEFDWPIAGMFIWIKIRYDTHPLLEIYGAEKVCSALWAFLTTKPFLCLAAPGLMFAPTAAVQEYAFQYLRLCFAPMPEDEVIDYAQHFNAGCRAFWQLQDFDGVPDLDEDMESGAGLKVW
ncbi:aromatic amino acid aminotransferase [Talaromyces proteolyticus]|uniref:Aromatic amino acid aminotransferase n=1 Tax=Talaromyces proteolyticus TaxID=1131652 RepID=A0AAD4Q1B1_9EURO|nr:aromatic amino acid aminotransferase [Talaromyces proteolyticus]KAH8702094.1 aromatic amino acid aminotransferase [Talaromyces proteolyticus]